MTMTLDTNQQEAVDSDSTAIVVVASAGSGKTEVIALRIQRLLANTEPTDRRILALTYTTKAANELQERLRTTSVDLRKIDAQTVHSFAHEIVRQYGTWEGFPPEPEVLTRDEDRVELLTDWLADAGIHLDPETALSTLRRIDLARAKLDWAHYLDEYRMALDSRKAIDYPAMLEVAQRLVEREWMRRQLTETYAHVIVDEAQNLTPAQYALITTILGEPPSSISAMFVGDDKQSIVEFAGANPALIIEFEESFNAERIVLEHNYRSAKSICEIADCVATKLGTKSSAQAVSAAIGSVTIEDLDDESHEGAFVAEWASRLINQGIPTNALAPGERTAILPEEIAIIARSTAALKPTAEALCALGIEVMLASTAEDWMASELGTAIMAYIEWRAGPNYPSTKTYLEEKAKVTLDDLSDSQVAGFANLTSDIDADHPSSLFDRLIQIDAIEYEENDEAKNWDSDRKLLISAWGQFCEQRGAADRTYANLSLFIAHAQRGHDTNTGVRLLTVHKSQGREFRAVAIVGLNEGQFPSYFAKSEKEQISELHAFYVAVTRASRILLLSRPKLRSGRNGSWEPNPSPYLKYAQVGAAASRPFTN